MSEDGNHVTKKLSSTTRTRTTQRSRQSNARRSKKKETSERGPTLSSAATAFVPMSLRTNSTAVENVVSTSPTSTVKSTMQAEKGAMKKKPKKKKKKKKKEKKSTTSTPANSRTRTKTRKKKKKTTKKKEATVTSKTMSGTTGWWRQISDDDPISLDPIAKLPYPPFALHASAAETSSSASVKNRDGTFYFDGKGLARYLIKTGNFIHPMNRRPLTLKDCQRLDAYLVANGLQTETTVEQVFQMSRVVKKRAGNDRSGPTNMQQGEAASMLGRLIHFSSYESRNAVQNAVARSRARRGARRTTPTEHPNAFRYQRAQYGDANDGSFRVVDDDEWIPEKQSTLEDFPTLPGSNTTSSHLNTTPTGNWWKRAAVSEDVSAMRNPGAFPTLSDSKSARDVEGSWRRPIAQSMTNTRRQTATTQTSQRRTKLKLLPRGSTNATDVAQRRYVHKNRSIFGAGRPRDVVEKDVGRTKTLLEQSEMPLCPYSEQLLMFAQTNLQWVSRVERQLADFVHPNGDGEDDENRTTHHLPATFDFPPMKQVQRMAIRSMALHWGLDVTSLDPEPSRSVRCSRSSSTRVPRLLLWDAAVTYKHLLMKSRWNDNALRFGEIASRSTFHMARIVAKNGRARPTLAMIHDMIESAAGPTLRRSEYNISWVSEYRTDCLVEWTSSSRARKIFSRLAENARDVKRTNKTTLHLCHGPLKTWIQWWGSDLRWATYQMERKDEIARAEGISDRDSRQKKITGDAWGADDDGDNAVVRESEPAEDLVVMKSVRTTSNPMGHHVVKKQDSVAEPSKTVWDTLASDDDDDDDDDDDREVPDDWELIEEDRCAEDEDPEKEDDA